jgi:hypothetical protein
VRKNKIISIVVIDREGFRRCMIQITQVNDDDITTPHGGQVCPQPFYSHFVGFFYYTVSVIIIGDMHNIPNEIPQIFQINQVTIKN